MKTNLIATGVAASLLVLGGCDVQKTDSGEMPSVDVDVSADSGEMPEYDVDWANVDVGTTTETVSVPELVVVMEETEVEVPYMDVNMPNESSDKSKRTIVVEAEVKEKMHDLTIDKVYAKDRRLVVVSNLNPLSRSLEGNTVRVSDRLVLNAPDLDIKHYIIGEKPMGDWNNQYTFVDNENELRSHLDGATELYSR